MKVKMLELSNYDNQTFNDNDKVWRVSRLIELSKNFPVQKIPMSGLNLCDLVPSEINTMHNFVGHIGKVLSADLKYPIILDDEGYVMDGRHRIARSLLEGKNSIKFVRFDKTPEPCYLSESE